MKRDPVCGMEVDEAAAPSSQHEGRSYYFCSEECKSAFDSDPAQYVRREGAA